MIPGSVVPLHAKHVHSYPRMECRVLGVPSTLGRMLGWWVFKPGRMYGRFDINTAMYGPLNCKFTFQATASVQAPNPQQFWSTCRYTPDSISNCHYPYNNWLVQHVPNVGNVGKVPKLFVSSSSQAFMHRMDPMIIEANALCGK